MEKSKPKRKWPIFTWLALVVVAAGLVVMNARGVPDRDALGVYRSDSKLGPIGSANSFDHGWPQKWLRSSSHASKVKEEDPFFTKLMAAYSTERFESVESRWVFSVFPESVDRMAIAVNGFTAFLVLAIVFLICRYRSKRNRVFKISLLEIGVLILIVSIALADFQKHQSVAQNEKEFLRLTGSVAEKSQYHGPAFLPALFGESARLDSYRHIEQLKINAFQSDEWPDGLVETFAWLRAAQFVGDLNIQQMESISKLNGLKSIEVSEESHGILRVFPPKKTRIIEDLFVVQNGEPHSQRIVKPDFIFPSVEQLKIDAVGSSANHWPRALDLVERCPNLKKVSLVGTQFLAEDLLNLPSDIEEIEFGSVGSPELDFLQQYFPKANIKASEKLSKVSKSRRRWLIAANIVNRRRECGWEKTQLRNGNLDLSQTDLDREFLQSINFLFPEVEKLVFGNFDSKETAMWLVEQCSEVELVDAKTTIVDFDEVMQWPKSIYWLELLQGSITAQQFAKIVKHLGLSRLKIEESDFDKEAIELILRANPKCNLIIGSKPLPVSDQETMPELKLNPPLE